MSKNWCLTPIYELIIHWLVGETSIPVSVQQQEVN